MEPGTIASRTKVRTPVSLGRYLWIEQTLGSVLFNFVLNGAIAVALTFRRPIPLWGATSIAVDLLVMSFLLPFGTCVFNTGLIRRDARNGRVAWLESLPQGALGSLPAATLARALLVSLAVVAAFVPPIVIGLCGAGITHLARWDFVVFKGTIAAIEAALVTPVVAIYALVSPRAVQTAPAVDIAA